MVALVAVGSDVPEEDDEEANILNGIWNCVLNNENAPLGGVIGGKALGKASVSGIAVDL